MSYGIRKQEKKFQGLSNYKVLLSSISYQNSAKYAYMETQNLELEVVYELDCYLSS